MSHTDQPAFVFITDDGRTMRVWENGMVEGFPPGKIINRISALVDCAEARGRAESKGWEPAFDACSVNQERLVREFCFEIAGPRGQPGSPPDPVRLLEMAQALYEAERDDLAPKTGAQPYTPKD